MARAKFAKELGPFYQPYTGFALIRAVKLIPRRRHSQHVVTRMSVYKMCVTPEEKVELYRQFVFYTESDPEYDAHLEQASVLIVVGSNRKDKLNAFNKSYMEGSTYAVVVQEEGKPPLACRFGLGTKTVHHRSAHDAFVDALLAEYGNAAVLVEFV